MLKSNKQKILEAFLLHGNRLTLGFALKHSWGYKMCSRISDLRAEGYVISFTRGETPSKNLYIFHGWRAKKK